MPIFPSLLILLILGRMLLYKYLSYFQKKCHTSFPAEYFLGLIWRLGSRVSSIFQTLSLKSIFNPVKHLLLSLFAKIVNSWYCYNQKQLSGCVLQERCSCKFCKIHRKEYALESRFLWSCRYTDLQIFIKKRDSSADVFLWILRNFS